MDLEEYIPRDAALRPQVPALILRHAQIHWSNWIAVQWDKTPEVPFPNLAGIWTAMENQDPWKPTFPADYNLSLETVPRTGLSGRWTAVDTSAVPTSSATAAAVASTENAESARPISGRRGISGGAIGGAWCCQDRRPYLRSCRCSLALRGHPRTPSRIIP